MPSITFQRYLPHSADMGCASAAAHLVVQQAALVKQGEAPVWLCVGAAGDGHHVELWQRQLHTGVLGIKLVCLGGNLHRLTAAIVNWLHIICLWLQCPSHQADEVPELA